MLLRMLTVLEKVKPRHMRIQRNTTNGQWSVGIPLETIQEVGWSKGTYVVFKVQDENKITVERVGG